VAVAFGIDQLAARPGDVEGRAVALGIGLLADPAEGVVGVGDERVGRLRRIEDLQQMPGAVIGEGGLVDERSCRASALKYLSKLSP
jgi:hypothetical protein